MSIAPTIGQLSDEFQANLTEGIRQLSRPTDEDINELAYSIVLSMGEQYIMPIDNPRTEVVWWFHWVAGEFRPRKNRGST